MSVIVLLSNLATDNLYKKQSTPTPL